MSEALLGVRSARGFYADAGAPRDHYSTPVTSGGTFCGLVADLLREVDRALGRPPELDLVDVGGGDGTLLRAVLALTEGSLAARVRPVLVDVHPDSEALPDSIHGLVVAVEWLDTLPVEVALADNGRVPRLVEVSADGTQRAQRALPEDDRAWLQTWWPARPWAESGLRRDRAWRDLAGRLTAGAALAVDYGHLRVTRPNRSTLTGWHRGRAIAPALDGSTDVTAHVAMDSLAAAGEAAGMSTLLMATLRQVLLARSAPPPSIPHPHLARQDPGAYLAALSGAGEHALLADALGLGAHHVLLQGRLGRGPAGTLRWP